MTLITVFVRFDGRGFKWPLRPGDSLELWTPEHELIGQLDASLLLDLLATYLRLATTIRTLGETVRLETLTTERMDLGPGEAPPPAGLPAPPPKPPVKIMPMADRRAAYRAQRKRRGGRIA